MHDSKPPASDAVGQARDDESQDAAKIPLAHITARSDFARALAEKVEITALCGHRWIPTRQNPPDLLACPLCVRILLDGYDSAVSA